MKKQTLSLITILGLLTVIIILVLRISEPPITNVYCEGRSSVPSLPSVCEIQPVPDSMNSSHSANTVMLYYKVDDNCNFQTLQFDASERLPDNYTYVNLGRFEGNVLADGKYQIDRLYVKSFSLKSGIPRKYKISKISLGKDTSEGHIYFDIEMSKVTGSENPRDVDYFYGQNPEEKAIVLNKNALIDFNISSFDGKTFPELPGGGYECNGMIITGGGG